MFEMITNKLKPCPFCGSKAHTAIKADRGLVSYEIRFTVECERCGIELIDKYFEDCEGHVLTNDDGEAVTDKYGQPVIIGAHPPTVTGLALWLGFKTRQSLLNYQARSEKFNDILTVAKSRCEEYAERRLYDRDGVNGAKFSLANNFKGWNENKDDSAATLAKLDDVLAKMIGGGGYAINTDYRIMADFETKINNADMSDKAAFTRILYETISALFIDKPNTPVQQVIEGMLWYYRCGKEPRAIQGGSKKRYYDYNEDSDFIYAAFKQQYGENLITSKLHWWEFRSMFTGLTDNTEFVKIMQYRGTDLSKIKNKDEKARIRKLQERYALNAQKMQKFATLEDRNEAFKRRLQERFKEVRKLSGEK